MGFRCACGGEELRPSSIPDVQAVFTHTRPAINALHPQATTSCKEGAVSALNSLLEPGAFRSLLER